MRHLKKWGGCPPRRLRGGSHREDSCPFAVKLRTQIWLHFSHCIQRSASASCLSRSVLMWHFGQHPSSATCCSSGFITAAFINSSNIIVSRLPDGAGDLREGRHCARDHTQRSLRQQVRVACQRQGCVYITALQQRADH